jgi:hypothetical protein
VNGYRLGSLAVSTLLLLGVGANPARADLEEGQAPERIATAAEVNLGYRGTSLHGAPNRALEYDSLESSPLFNAKLFTDQDFYRLDLGIDYLNEQDYSAAASIDTREVFHLDLRTERFYHNLDHIPYDNGPPPAEGSRPDASVLGLDGEPLPEAPLRAYYSDQNPGDDYGLRLDLGEAKLKIKCPDYPAHVNLSFWRYEKQGERQLRFADENCTTACHMQSKSRKIDRVTEEVKLGADAHAGFVDLAIEALYRTFRDRQDIPIDRFGEHAYPDPVDRNTGIYDHDEDPDSQLRELTFLANTAPAGGFVASASFTLGERENNSDLNSIAPVEAETDYYKTSADVTYTPGENWTFNLRYRLLDMDSDNTGVITTNSSSTNPNDLAVRESPDLTRAWYEALVNYRPSKRLTLKAEFRREDLERSNTGPAQPFLGNGGTLTAVQINPTWQLPDQETITRVKLGFHSRMLEKSALKVSGWVALQRNDDPAYGTSFADRRELFLSASYTHGPLWGITANLNVLDEENDEFSIDQFSEVLQGDTLVIDSAPDHFDLDRERQQQNASIGAWLMPREGLSFDINYGYLRTAIDQDLLFGSGRNIYDTDISYAIEDGDVEYRQTVQTISAGVSWQATEQLSCRLEGHHIRSKANYSPNFPTSTFPYYSQNSLAEASSSELRQISKLDLRQNGVSGRVDWKFDEHWATSLEATHDDYDELGNDVYDGSVQTCMVSLSRSW